MNRYGIMGGTFNPIHNAHLYIAYEAMNQLNLDKIIFMVAGVPPHKVGENIVEANSRLQMVNLAISNYENFEVSDYEIKKNGLSYTYETLEHFKDSNTELFFITGADCLHDIEKWKNPQRILNACTFVVFNRGGYKLEKLIEQTNYIKLKYNANIVYLNTINLELSSTILRERILQDKRVDFFIPKSVLNYIYNNDLYKGRSKMTVESTLSIDDIKKYLKSTLKESRYNHVLGVVETAKELASLNKVSVEKAELAALGHDIAKNLPLDQMESVIIDNKLQLTDSEKKSKELWHSIISPILGREKLHITDEEVLSAMRWHTTGKENMSTLEKVIYIADMIEPGRVFPGVEEIRRVALEDLDKAVLMGLNHTINYLSSKNLPIDINTIKARDYLMD